MSTSSGSTALEIAGHLPVQLAFHTIAAKWYQERTFPDTIEITDFKSNLIKPFEISKNWDSIYNCNDVNKSSNGFLNGVDGTRTRMNMHHLNQLGLKTNLINPAFTEVHLSTQPGVSVRVITLNTNFSQQNSLEQ